MRRQLAFVITVGVFLVGIGGGGLLFRMKQQQIAARTTAAAAASAKTSSSSKPGADPPHVRGPATATVTLEEFGDFECRPCGDLSPILEKIEQDYGASLRVIFREFPLAVHRHALDAARAAEAAGLQGRFWEMHDLLYHNRFIWPRAPDGRTAFGDFAKSLGLDLERFKKDMDSEQVNARIAADRERGASLGVNQTPVVFVNDRQVPPNSLTPPGLRAAIDVARNQKPGR
jgi:protein-disulfide isomerase